MLQQKGPFILIKGQLNVIITLREPPLPPCHSIEQGWPVRWREREIFTIMLSKLLQYTIIGIQRIDKGQISCLSIVKDFSLVPRSMTIF